MDLDITFSDYPSKEDMAIICYFYGCEHNCKDCHNKELQKSEDKNILYVEDLIKFCKRNNTNKIVFSGGDPLFGDNLLITKLFCKELKKDYNICIYTGYPIEYVDFDGFKFIKCGKYDINNKQKSLKNDNFIQFASTNQNLYDCNKKLISNKGRYEFG
jgi:anaerobic ribonucleoside-triphosphate reductase activating protein